MTYVNTLFPCRIGHGYTKDKNCAKKRCLFFAIALLFSAVSLFGQKTLTESLYLQFKGAKLEPAGNAERDMRSGLVYTPERNEKVNISFTLCLPQVLLSENWRVILTPMVMTPDTIISLNKFYVTGHNFRLKQIEDSTKYQELIASVVPKDEYNKVFLDFEGISKDITSRQELYRDQYRKDFLFINAYKKWYKNKQDKYDSQNIKEAGEDKKKFHKYISEANFEKKRLLAQKKDTTGVFAKHIKKYKPKAKYREITEKDVPSKFLTLYRKNIDYRDLKPDVMTEKDSVEIASGRYLFDKIERNEYIDQNRAKLYSEMVPFPLHEDYCKDTIVDAKSDFICELERSLPITGDMENVKVFVLGKIIAIDQSFYNIPVNDTLSYSISSLNQLADTALITRHYKIYRNMFSKMTFYPEFEANKYDFNARNKANKMMIDSLMNSYKSFTDKDLRIDSVRLYMTSSLDGSWDFNVNLTQKRADAIKSYLKRSYSDINVENIFIAKGKSEDWYTLAKMVKESVKLENKEAILDKLAKTVHPDKTEAELRWDPKFRKDYKYLKANVFPKMRKADITMYISRPGMTAADSIVGTYREDYAEGIRLLQKRQYWDAVQQLAKYPDYNTALNLILIDNDEKALNLLERLEQTPNVMYLSSIAAYKIGKKDEAKDFLLNACEQDPELKWRAILDVETKDLIKQYNLDIKPEIKQPEDEESELSSSEDPQENKESETKQSEAKEKESEQTSSDNSKENKESETKNN